MELLIDTREHKNEVARITRQFDAMRNVTYARSKLFVGDYMSLDNARLCIDRKKNLDELVGNITGQHKRFTDELIRAKQYGIKLVILVEHGEGIERLSDVYWWHNTRLNLSEWVFKDGIPQKVQKYPKAVSGESLYKSLVTIRDHYGVDFDFCDKEHTGEKIVEILRGEDNGG